MIIVLLFCVILIAVLAGFYFSVLGSLRTDAPFVPSGRKELRWILTEVAKVRPGEVFYDLGSGDGRVVGAAARLGARAVGIEQSLLLVWWSRLINVILKSRNIHRELRNPTCHSRVIPASARRNPVNWQPWLSSPRKWGSSQTILDPRFRGGDRKGQFRNSKIRIIHGNYFKENLSDANVIFCYLMPKAMEILKEKFEKELKPGSRVISRAFKVSGWTIAERHQFRKRTPPVYVYYL